MRCWASIAFITLFFTTSAQALECYKNGDVVTLRGTTSARTLTLPDGTTKTVSVLESYDGACALQSVPWSNILHRFDLRYVQVIGQPPPLGVPISLTGVLETGHDSPTFAEPFALRVASGHKLVATTDPQSESVAQTAPVPQAQSGPQAASETSSSEAAPIVLSESSTTMPDDETAVVKAAQTAINQYNAAPNDMLKGATRPDRARAVCAALPTLRAVDWLGTVKKLDSNGDGKGVLYITIAPSVSVGTWNNDMSDTSDATLIDPKSKIFTVASHLEEGQEVRFNGVFFPSDVDCIEESSLTLSGSIMEPEYIIRFDSIEPITIASGDTTADDASAPDSSSDTSSPPKDSTNPSDAESGSHFLELLIALLIVVYFFPTLVALLRRNHNTMAVFILNLFLGWTFVGWVISLVWAVKN